MLNQHLKGSRSDYSFCVLKPTFYTAGCSVYNCWIQLDKELNTTRRKSGHSSALLNVNLAFQFLECMYPGYVYPVTATQIQSF